MKIGIYGGTFSPIHNGHLHIAENAKRIYDLDKVIFLPSGNSYMKKNVIAQEHRYRMVCLATEDISGYEVSDMEIRRKGKTYSYVSMENFRSIYPADNLYFIMGEDSLRMLEKWKEPQRLLKQCELIVAARRDENGFLRTAYDIEYLEKKYNTHIYFMQMDENISSSMIREKMAKGENISDYVPEIVKDYIINNHLYSTDS